MARNLIGLFSPKSVAVIGASRSAEKVGAVALKNIIDSGFTGKIFPVNPNTESIGGFKCFPNVNSIPEIPDLAVVAIPAPLVLENLKEIGEKGIKNVVVFSAGFKEIGTEGEKLQNGLTEIANKYAINLLGPNCFGFVNNLLPINVTFGQVASMPGNIRFVTQSGALASSLFDWCKTVNLGFSDFVTLGNKAILSENDILRFWLEDPTEKSFNKEGISTVSPIGMYLEGIANGSEFFSIASQISQKDPVFVLKPGKSKAAAAVMQSHTGSIAGEDSVLEQALAQSGVIRCQNLEDFFDLGRSFAWENVPQGPNVAIVSNAGGPTVLSADAITQEGLRLAEFDEETKQKLIACLPKAANSHNPVDVIGDALADLYAKAIEIVLRDKEVQSLIVILTPQLMTEIEKTASVIVELSKKYSQPIFCSFIGGDLTAPGEKILNQFKIPSFPYPERAVRAISAMWHWQEWKTKKTTTSQNAKLPLELDLTRAKQILDQVKKENRKILNNSETNELVTSVGIPTPATQIVEDLEQAKAFCQQNSYPVVLKLNSPELLHKTEVGGVITQITTEDELIKAWEILNQKIEKLTAAKIQIQKQISGGVEVITGIKVDPHFGPVLLFGAGGKLAEVIEDKNLFLLPTTPKSIKDLVANSKVNKILSGFRGEIPYNLTLLYEMIAHLGKLAENLPEIAEIEINPVIITYDNVWAVDTKVILTEENKSTSTPDFKKAVATSHTTLASKFHSFVFEPEEPLIYQPGQYISIKVAEDRINAYSIAGKAGEKGFTILVDISPGGPGSKFFESLKVGEKISYLGPFGNFVSRENDGAEQLLFLGTGSGCSPLKCIIEALLKEKNWQLPLNLYFGLRYTNDVFWREYFQDLSERYPNFHFKLSLSKPDEAWGGFSGHITDFLPKDFPDASKLGVYLCGNKKMIEEATKILIDLKCPKERIYTEEMF